MSDLLPTKEQEDVADAICTWIDDEFGSHRLGDVDAIALLLAEREEALRVVICRLRACLHHAIMDEDVAGCMLADSYNNALAVLRETVQYEVVK